MATIIIPDDLQHSADEYARRNGERLDELVARLLRNLTLHSTGSLTDLDATRQQSIARLVALPSANKLPANLDYQKVMREEQRARYGHESE